MRCLSKLSLFTRKNSSMPAIRPSCTSSIVLVVDQLASGGVGSGNVFWATISQNESLRASRSGAFRARSKACFSPLESFDLMPRPSNWPKGIVSVSRFAGAPHISVPISETCASRDGRSTKQQTVQSVIGSLDALVRLFNSALQLQQWS